MKNINGNDPVYPMTEQHYQMVIKKHLIFDSGLILSRNAIGDILEKIKQGYTEFEVLDKETGKILGIIKNATIKITDITITKYK